MIICGNCKDVLKQIPDKSVRCCVTSPPYYGLRDYGVSEQIGQEDSPKDYINNLVCVFNEVHRVLTDDGTLWINIGDSYCGTGDKGNITDPKNPLGRNGQVQSITKNIDGIKHKDLIGIPWMLAFALRDSGWYLRQDIIWSKPNAMPEPVKDRCTKSHEYIFLLSKSQHYYFDNDAIKEMATRQDSCSNTKFGGMKYGYSDDPCYRTKSGNIYIYQVEQETNVMFGRFQQSHIQKHILQHFQRI